MENTTEKKINDLLDYLEGLEEKQLKIELDRLSNDNEFLRGLVLVLLYVFFEQKLDHQKKLSKSLEINEKLIDMIKSKL